MALLECKNLCFGYDRHEIFHDINFSVSQGEFLSILGENGSGKTTLMKTILGLQNQISGSVLTGDGLKRNEIGYLPQQTEFQRDFPATVYEIVLSGCQSQCGFRPFYSAEEKQTAMNNMKKMGIAGLKKRCYRELSGGQMQRVLLARALCATKKILLLDEPTAGLDSKVTAEMYKLISDLNKEGIAIIMITHDIRSALDMSSHILYLGKSVFFGKTEEFISSGLSVHLFGEEFINEND